MSCSIRRRLLRQRGICNLFFCLFFLFFFFFFLLWTRITTSFYIMFYPIILRSQNFDTKNELRDWHIICRVVPVSVFMVGIVLAVFIDRDLESVTSKDETEVKMERWCLSWTALSSTFFFYSFRLTYYSYYLGNKGLASCQFIKVEEISLFVMVVLTMESPMEEKDISFENSKSV